MFHPLWLCLNVQHRWHNASPCPALACRVQQRDRGLCGGAVIFKLFSKSVFATRWQKCLSVLLTDAGLHRAGIYSTYWAPTRQTVMEKVCHSSNKLKMDASWIQLLLLLDRTNTCSIVLNKEKSVCFSIMCVSCWIPRRPDGERRVRVFSCACICLEVCVGEVDVHMHVYVTGF